MVCSGAPIRRDAWQLWEQQTEIRVYELKFRVDLVLDSADARALAPFWSDALHYREHADWPGGVVLVPRQGAGPPLVLQQVPESKQVKNRMHLDITTDNVESEAERLERLGARRTSGLNQSGSTFWIRMADPQGNEFCVCEGVEW